jgi:uncharacterized membrane protein
MRVDEVPLRAQPVNRGRTAVWGTRMTDTPAAAPNGANRTLAMVNYALLFASVFFAGVPGLIAVVLAYAQRDQADAHFRSHFDFQIRIFWVALALAVVAGVCGVAGVAMAVCEALQYGATSWDAWEGFDPDFSEIAVSAGLVITLVASVALWILSALWLLGTSAFGFIRLASDRRIGQQAA